MRSPIITLSPVKVHLAQWVAERRVRNVIERDLRAVNNEPMDHPTLMRQHVSGALGEVAGKLWLDPIEWNPMEIDKPDLGGVIDVKAVEVATHHLLIGVERASADLIYLLARGHDHPTWRMTGWIDGATALARRDWIRTPAWGPCIVVPNDALAPVRDLWDYVERWLPADRSGESI